MKKFLAALTVLVTLVVAGTALAGARVWITCSGCNGSGHCTSCGGLGHVVMGGPNGQSMQQPCPTCGSTGRCSACGGNGGSYYQP
ncbi:MAG: hypothetical protein IJ774_08935 [Selenomonadaceae bacterium]|nr:hypothetical protein [Selenomonadaceae bacterium]